MSGTDFTISFAVDRSPEEVSNAIKGMRQWWSEEIQGPTDKVGDVFNYQYKDIHRCTLKMAEAIPGKRVAWLVTNNYFNFNFTEDKTEWQGTRLLFDIAKRHDGKTEVRFTHEGLVQDYECYEVCSTSWGCYINGSLKKLITTGKGHPNLKE